MKPWAFSVQRLPPGLTMSSAERRLQQTPVLCKKCESGQNRHLVKCCLLQQVCLMQCVRLPQNNPELTEKQSLKLGGLRLSSFCMHPAQTQTLPFLLQFFRPLAFIFPPILMQLKYVPVQTTHLSPLHSPPPCLSPLPEPPSHRPHQHLLEILLRYCPFHPLGFRVIHFTFTALHNSVCLSPVPSSSLSAQSVASSHPLLLHLARFSSLGFAVLSQ